MRPFLLHCPITLCTLSIRLSLTRIHFLLTALKKAHNQDTRPKQERSKLVWKEHELPLKSIVLNEHTSSNYHSLLATNARSLSNPARPQHIEYIYHVLDRNCLRCRSLRPAKVHTAPHATDEHFYHLAHPRLGTLERHPGKGAFSHRQDMRN